ncbi:MAG: ATPase P [Lentisphaeria bacterium]|nr:ATPase P [Lentisphaeria bacterium]NQZ70124.1 ATPase P [Lentisphaeria bacterium]
MINTDIPGHGKLELKYLVSDYNGTLACDGILLPDISPLIIELSKVLEIHVLTADTFGIAKNYLEDLPVTLTILGKDNQDQGKLDFVNKLGADSVVTMGNGRNDKLMLADSALGICLLQKEGLNVQTLQSADILCSSAVDALELLLNPKRLTATLRR